MPRRFPGALAALVVFLATAPAILPTPALAQAAGGLSLLIEGKGFGHGVGMPQDGAHAMATAGASATEILARFYPGTSIGRRGGTVQVHVHESNGPVVVSLPSGGEVRDALGGAQSPGFPVTVLPGGTVQLSFAGGAYRAKPLSGATLARIATPPTTAPAPVRAPATPSPPPTTPPATGLLDPLVRALTPSTAPQPRPATPAVTAAPRPAAPAVPTEAVSAQGLWAVPKGDSLVGLPAQDRRYRGTIQATAAGGGLQLTNTLDVEQYVRGMAEVPASWPAAALQAQVIAARTFAMRAAAAGQALCDDQQCQVYVGAGNEHPATNAAAAATRGRVLMFQGSLAEAVYSASAGGVSATTEEGFGPGSPDVSYLRPASYDIADPQAWAVTAPVGQLGARFGYRGEVTDVRVSRTGPSGRPLEITFDGGNGPMVVDGHRFWRQLDLRSSLYTLRVQSSEALAGADAAPLDALVPDLPAVGNGTPGRVILAASAPSLGRAPWIGLATLLLATWALYGARSRAHRPAAAASVVEEPDRPPDQRSAPFRTVGSVKTGMVNVGVVGRAIDTLGVVGVGGRVTEVTDDGGVVGSGSVGWAAGCVAGVGAVVAVLRGAVVAVAVAWGVVVAGAASPAGAVPAVAAATRALRSMVTGGIVVVAGAAVVEGDVTLVSVAICPVGVTLADSSASSRHCPPRARPARVTPASVTRATAMARDSRSCSVRLHGPGAAGSA